MTMQKSPCDFEPDYYQRRIQSKGKSYPIAVSPYAGECIEDLLIRAACENGFAPIMSYKLLGISKRISHKLAPGPNRYGITPEALSILLGNPGGPEELSGLLHDVPPPQRHLKPFFDVWLDSRTLTANRRVSPLALREAPFLRSIWRVWPISFDPGTKETLLKDCPDCKKSLSSEFMGEVWCCDRCNEITSEGELRAFDLRECTQPLVDEHLWDNLDFATSFVDPTARDRRLNSRSSLHADFVGLSDGEIFEVIFAMARLMPSEAANAPRLEIPAANLAAAAEIVRGWPASFERQITDGKAEMAPSKYSLRSLLYNSRVSRTLRERMKDMVRASTVQSTLSAHRSIGFFRTPRPVHEYRNLRKWIKQGAYDPGSDELSDALLLRARTDIRTLAAGIGISIPSLMALVDNGFFPPNALEESSRSQLAANAMAVVDKLLKNSLSAPIPKGAVRLPRAVGAFFAGSHDPWSVIFDALLTGQLKYWCTGRSQSSILEGIYVEDLHALCRVLRNAPTSRRPLHSIPLSVREAAFITRLQETGLAAATKVGLIATPFTWKSITKFRSEYEPSTFLSVRYVPNVPKVMTREMQGSLRAKGITPVEMPYTGMLTVWRRCQVEQFFAASLLPRVN